MRQMRQLQLLVIDFKAIFEVLSFASCLLFIQQETASSFFFPAEDDMRQIPLHLNSLLKHTSHTLASFACHRGPFLSV